MAEYYQSADVYVPGSYSPSSLSEEAASYKYPESDRSLVGVNLAEKVEPPQYPMVGVHMILHGDAPYAGEVAAQFVRRYSAISTETLKEITQ